MKPHNPFLPKAGEKVPLGRVEGEGETLYRSRPAITRSLFLDFMPPQRPSYFFGRWIAKSIPPERIEKRLQGYFDVGSQVNTLVLEGVEKFNSLYIEKPNFGRGPAAQVRKTEWLRANRTKKHIGAAAWKKLHRLRESVHGHKIAGVLLREGAAETTWRIRTSEALWQCRTDWFIDSASAELCDLVNAQQGCELLHVGDAVPIDLKTCQALGDEGYGSFCKEMVSLRYDVQEAFYSEIIAAVLRSQDPTGPIPAVSPMLFVAVEKQEPMETAIYTVEPDDATATRDQVRRHLARLAQCLRSNDWPGVAQDRVHRVAFPGWRRKAMEREAEEAEAFAGATGGAS